MEEIDIQNKLTDWQKRMDAKKAAEEEQRRLEAEKHRQQYVQRTERMTQPFSRTQEQR